MRLSFWRLIPISVFLALCVFLWRGLSLNPHQLPSTQIGRAVPDLKLPELNHSNQLIALSQMKGKVFLLNVWASWCAACTEEQIVMMDLAKSGIPVYGLNYKDDTKDAIDWLSQWGNPYEKVLQDRDGRAAIDLGVYGAPETFIIDKKGIIRYRHAGVLTAELWAKELQPLVKQLQGAG